MSTETDPETNTRPLDDAAAQALGLLDEADGPPRVGRASAVVHAAVAERAGAFAAEAQAQRQARQARPAVVPRWLVLSGAAAAVVVAALVWLGSGDTDTILAQDGLAGDSLASGNGVDRMSPARPDAAAGMEGGGGGGGWGVDLSVFDAGGAFVADGSGSDAREAAAWAFGFIDRLDAAGDDADDEALAYDGDVGDPLSYDPLLDELSAYEDDYAELLSLPEVIQ